MFNKWRLILITLITCIFIQSIVFAQDAQYQSLISGMEHYRDGKYKEALEDFQKAIVIFLTIRIFRSTSASHTFNLTNLIKALNISKRPLRKTLNTRMLIFNREWF